MVALLIGQSEAQRNKRRRNRKKSDQCHLREVETCINKMQQLGKGKDPTSIIATSKGLDKICRYGHFSIIHLDKIGTSEFRIRKNFILTKIALLITGQGWIHCFN